MRPGRRLLRLGVRACVCAVGRRCVVDRMRAVAGTFAAGRSARAAAACAGPVPCAGPVACSDTAPCAAEYRLAGGRQAAEGLLRTGRVRDVVVDREDGDGLAGPVAAADRLGLEDLAALGPGEVGESVVQARRVGLERLRHDVGQAVAHVAAGDVDVLNRDDHCTGVGRMEVVDHHLAVAADCAATPAARRFRKPRCSVRMECTPTSSPLPGGRAAARGLRPKPDCRPL